MFIFRPRYPEQAREKELDTAIVHRPHAPDRILQNLSEPNQVPQQRTAARKLTQPTEAVYTLDTRPLWHDFGKDDWQRKSEEREYRLEGFVVCSDTTSRPP
ncbi:hypothetical protein CLAFUW4_10633 [Fulvia fulva]|uniref:Uncharacterized protein n=1 Tax=Passalora fulva TaxID=5499 RepID=A0A9Q8LF65_PASFU|nr:uncharacterized protein CLAFUR5_05246 [Fulvia fulva]KAK4615531.1 hypothetical protein CLAFUR4_10638 [Fulvia fulva]KAK4617385.1 hypothetical protein CLAFUR0_10606 [Fulvia fulva]UJO16272.1 hypothetical protein CLAFUR5_05246 [Fulvia fulva]WPV18896.1 hypothetical protein CLAFUW4_10633 [Fulvia fulva]WPV34498.1 hypothetical protein CLAFUW7_10635 [Fulvia fulva]